MNITDRKPLYHFSLHLLVFLFIAWFMCRILSHLRSVLVRHRIAWHQIISTIFTICTMRSQAFFGGWLPACHSDLAGCFRMSDSFKSGSVERHFIPPHSMCSYENEKKGQKYCKGVSLSFESARRKIIPFCDRMNEMNSQRNKKQLIDTHTRTSYTWTRSAQSQIQTHTRFYRLFVA